MMRIFVLLLFVLACDDPPAAPASDAGVTRDAEPERDADSINERDAELADARTGDAKPADAEPADAEPADAEPADAEPGDAGPADIAIDSGPDCENLPAPVVTQLVGPVAAADVAFDRDGHLVASDGSAILEFNRDGTFTVLTTLGAYGGLEFTATGDLLATRDESLLRISPDGAQQVLLSDLAFGFGIAVDMDGFAWVADRAVVRRVDPLTGTSTIMIDAYDVSPKVLSFDASYRTLYIGTADTSTVYTVEVDVDRRAVGQPAAWGRLPVGDQANFDGIGVDVCGNVYAAEFESKGLYRIGPQGGLGVLLVQWTAATYGHGLEWGSGIGGWDPEAIYQPQPFSDSVVEVKLGVGSKPRPYP